MKSSMVGAESLLGTEPGGQIQTFKSSSIFRVHNDLVCFERGLRALERRNESSKSEKPPVLETGPGRRKDSQRVNTDSGNPSNHTS